METKHTSYRISDEGKQILKLLSKKLGVTDTAILEIAIRKYGEMEGVSGHESPFRQHIAKVLGDKYQESGDNDFLVLILDKVCEEALAQALQYFGQESCKKLKVSHTVEKWGDTKTLSSVE